METRDGVWLMPCALFLILSFVSQPSMAADSISVNETISGDKTIVSSGEVFRLGFFRPGKATSSKHYIGIWYNKVSDQTVVWVANRDAPISDPSASALKFSNGNLVLLNESRIPVWSTNISSTPLGSLRATIQDDGNFVLKNGPNSSKPLWQSFDFPTDTWLPGSKLGRNDTTKQTQSLTAWKNPEDPGSGLFSLELDPNGTSAYFIMWNRTRQYWSSGPWVDNMFSLVPEMRLNYLYNFSFVTANNESYFTYSMYNASVISRFVMDVSGQAKQFTWLESSKQWNLFWGQPRQQCEVYALCGAFGSCTENSSPICSCVTGFEPKSSLEWDLKEYSGGCRRKTKLACENPVPSGGADRFLLEPYMKLPDPSQSMAVANDRDCESLCLRNCSCIAYSYKDRRCEIWSGDLLDMRKQSPSDPGTRSLYLRLAASEFSSRKRNTGMIIGIVVGSAAVLATVLAVLFLLLRRRRIVGKGKTVEGSLVAFEYRDLQNATKNFSHKLGGGGFGSVFKGSLADSTIVAVKKLESVSQGEKQFRTEVSTIGTIQHVNLIRLRGFCSEGSKKLLVYDYMPNGSLDAHLFHDKVLDWKTRYQIAVGTARGLAYLHEKCRECIVHCDIKPENILLDAQFCPKVADFGLAKLFGREFSRVLTTMRGTRGYLAPEWISGVAITAKADVFSYGMMLFEFVSGRRNSEQSEDGTIKFFPSLVANTMSEEGDIRSLLDSKLQGNADVEELKKLCNVACWCIQDEEVQRPSMSNIVQILEGVLEVNKPPMPRSLLAFNDSHEHLVFFTESSSSSSSNQNSKTSSTTSSSQAKSSTSTTSSSNAA
ncbi:G-type lectin S-receptor-like serine/threonine-protein kinase At2g19130 [Cucurbita maxima]|uniref:Receptor-like serine/threonine-protein kinase n=1 Tax=Cucurbita maxima TaxID=3661 RepID=A0A6J1HZM8_CUCMA|nr:G-type lectin S-receptor-like serine/threonine-protein kinase At2g19130 [Cucurbita maxima]